MFPYSRQDRKRQVERRCLDSHGHHSQQFLYMWGGPFDFPHGAKFKQLQIALSTRGTSAVRRRSVFVVMKAFVRSCRGLIMCNPPLLYQSKSRPIPPTPSRVICVDANHGRRLERWFLYGQPLQLFRAYTAPGRGNRGGAGRRARSLFLFLGGGGCEEDGGRKDDVRDEESANSPVYCTVTSCMLQSNMWATL